MLRSVAGVIVGYLVMALLVFLLFTVAYFILGTERSYQPDSYEVSGLWIVISLVLGFVAAILGGMTCTALARGGKAPMVLALLVLVLGLIMGIVGSDMSDKPTVRTGDVSNMEAMSNSRPPAWSKFVDPFLGAIGVLVGARLRRRAA